MKTNRDRIEAVYTKAEISEADTAKADASEAGISETDTAEADIAKEERSETDTGTVIDGQGAYLIPGMIDLHFHGCMGADFCDGSREALEKIARYELSVGVTSICPAVMTLSLEDLVGILSEAAAFHKTQQDAPLATLVGINMEGPFISRKKRAAQAKEYIIPPSEEIFHRFQAAAGGLIRFLGIAPEEGDKESNLAFIRNISEKYKYMTVSLAHTNADYDTAMEAFDAGARHVVHLYNAMSGCTHRSPGVVGAAADDSRVMAELICDGVHVHPTVVRSTFRLFGKDRLILISDSMRATGMPDGTYTLGGQEVTVRGNRAVLASNEGVLAGSVTNLPDCVRTAVRSMRIPLEEALAAATINPARSLGIQEDYGTIEPGKKADLVLWGEDLSLKTVIKDGRIVCA